jgi:hypothetical protein
MAVAESRRCDRCRRVKPSVKKAEDLKQSVCDECWAGTAPPKAPPKYPDQGTGRGRRW